MTFKLRYLAIASYVMFLLTILMPTDWHYERIGTIQKIQIDTTYYSYDIDKIQPLLRYTYQYRTDDGVIRNETLEGTTSYYDINIINHIISYNNKYMYDYKLWTLPWLYVVPMIVFLIWGAFLMSSCYDDESGCCSHCGLYLFCSRPDKKKTRLRRIIGAFIRSVEERQKKNAEEIRIKSDNKNNII